MADIKKHAQRLSQLSFSEWRVLIASVFLLPLVALLLRMLGYRKVRRWMSKYIPMTADSSEEPAHSGDTARATARMIDIASRRSPYRASCLEKSLLIWWLLGRRGIESEIKIGVADVEGQFSAHAWVEADDQILIGGTDSRIRYKPML